MSSENRLRMKKDEIGSRTVDGAIQQEGSEAQTQILAGIRPHSERSFL